MSNRALYLRAAEDLRENEGQWAAYNSTGHCVVVAGPGSGKTKTLTLKLARILAEDVDHPRGVACITYNNECARELEQRLEALGIEPNTRVFIGTVHSFSLTQIILPYAKTAKLNLPDDFTIANLADQRRALEEAFKAIVGGPDNPQHWRMRLDRHRRAILDRDSDQWRDLDPQLSELVTAYEARLRVRGLIDFDDMPLIAARALHNNEWLRTAILAKYPVLAVDEYQDLGVALHRIVQRLCFTAGIRLFAVGDADQSIYGFTGANPAMLRRLMERPDVEKVYLRLNYRCGSRIVKASSYALGEHRDYRAPLTAPQGTIYFHARSGSYSQHADFFFGDIMPEILARIPDLQPGGIAILYPTAAIGDDVYNAALRAGYQTIRTDGNALYPRSSRLMRWLENCAIWCCGGWKSGNPRFSKLESEGYRIFAEATSLESARASFKRAFIHFLWTNRDPSVHISEWLTAIHDDLLSDLFKKCRTLGDEADTLANFLKRLAPDGDVGAMSLGDFSGQEFGIDRLNLSTLHSAKGREFRVVVLFAMDRGRIPWENARPEQVLESRRLFYVGFTRAKTELHIMHSASRPSPFVSEVVTRLEQEG